MSKIVDYRIVISENATTSEIRAASFVRTNVKLVCGKTLEIVKDSEKPVELEIVVGKTNREALDGVALERSRDGLWEYVMFNKGRRFYMTGLGVPPEEVPYTSAYRKIDDGAVGTVIAAYHFVEDVLKYQFIYAAYDVYPETPDLEMPEEYLYEFTREAFSKQRPENIEGASIHFLQCSGRLDWNDQSFIIKTKAGRLIAFDGGHPGETDRFIESLKVLSGEEVPTVSAWFMSHMHNDHWGVYYRLCTDEEYKGKVKVENFYCNLATEEFYTKLSRECSEGHIPVRNAILGSKETTGADVHTVVRGDVIEVDDISFEVLHAPLEKDYTAMNMNDSSVVYKMTHKDSGQTILFLGDAEWVCSNNLIENSADKLKSDIVQVGHHGCGNVSRKCYELIDADVYWWPIGERFWYGESGEGLNTHNVGVERYRTYMKEIGVKNENIYVNLDRIISSPLPFPIY
ncbi:MAG: hypothetical protein E7641_07245 [Ruminococcaceae bacterium]|nr:hypothetical protein [Oscillospiraceae bacterium]